MPLTTRRGKEPITVWRRGRWTSMPHLSDGVAEDGTTATRCGHYVAIFDTGVDAMAHTQIATDLFVAIGCGSCRNSLARDLRDEMNATMPFAKEQLKKLLATSRWETKTE